MNIYLFDIERKSIFNN